MIEIKSLTKKYGDFTAIENLSLKIEESSIYGLVGSNGAGKTTLLKTAIGIFKADQGKVLIDGENVYDNEEIRKTMFFVPDEIYFLPQASIVNMAKFYRGFFPMWNDNLRKRLTDMFKLDDRKHIARFSKGMQRQTAILLALSSNPKYLFLDELFDGLDPVIRRLVRELMLEVISGTQTTVVVSTHNIKELENLCDHIGIIKNKNIIYSNSIEVLSNSKFKCRAIFSTEPKPEEFSSINLRALNIAGKIATFIASDSEEALDAKLTHLNPILIEKIPLTLEEVILEEMEVEDYDFTGLFN